MGIYTVTELNRLIKSSEERLEKLKSIKAPAKVILSEQNVLMERKKMLENDSICVEVH